MLLNVKSDGLQIYAFLSVFDVSYGLVSSARCMRIQNLGAPKFDISTLEKVKSGGVIEFPTHGFLLVFNSCIWPNSAPLRDITSTFKATRSDRMVAMDSQCGFLLVFDTSI